MAGTLMVQGTSSSAGKSLTVTGLVRLFRQEGYTVAPFKAQNMSLNSYPAIEGGEIGRAQVAQAEAAGLPPSVHMNPVLLKPTTDVGAQVIVLGKPIGHMGAREYHEFKSSLLPVVKESLDHLRSLYDVVVIEGAGSPAEINLRENDIVNMAVAHLADANVVLVADIDRGGVFASIYGTWALLDDADRARLRAFIVNRFRGDVSILEPGIREIEDRTGMVCLGVVPYLRDVGIDDEDSVSLDETTEAQGRQPRDAQGWPLGDGPRVAIVRLPRISNFTDFRPLETCGLFRVRWVDRADEVEGADLIVIPGTKSTVGDLLAMRERGLEEAIRARRDAGAHVLGVCGGYQMLGERILDPEHVESARTETPGLALLPLETTFAAEKVTEPVRVRGAGAGWLASDAAVVGYEIHMGRTVGPCRPLFLVESESPSGDDGPGAALSGVAPTLDGEAGAAGAVGGPPPVIGTAAVVRGEGAVSDDGRVSGSYVHGLFDDFSVLAGLARVLGVAEDRIEALRPGYLAHQEAKDQAYERLAAVFREHLDLKALHSLVFGSDESGETAARTTEAGA
jgi:adenosylcobyric acid synthase